MARQTVDPDPTEQANHIARDESQLVAALRAGDARAFAELVARYQPAMLRLAQLYVPSRAVAEDVVQEAWLGLIKGIDGFEGRASLKTWLFRILTNSAKTVAARERRTVSFSELWEPAGDGPTVDPERFYGEDAGAVAHHWRVPPAPWGGVDDALDRSELRAALRAAIDDLPANQRAVITLRDVSGWSSDEVCNILGVSEVNQRVLLHRARAKVRAALDRHLSPSRAAS